MTESDVCEWTEILGVHAWNTSCDAMFGLCGETLKENEYNFCPKCGKRIKEIPLSQEAEE